MRKTYDEFPEIEIPELLQGKDWIDTSWHNDVTASSTKTVIDPYDVVVWVWDDDVNEREYDGQDKYQVTIYDTGLSVDDFFSSTDSEEELKTIIDNAIEHIKNLQNK